MLRLDNVSKSHGQQILFIETSMSVFAGDKVGLVGPNGAGKSTIFRMLTGQEQPDSGSVSVDRNVVLGYFSQDVGEMRGRSVLAETMAGAGEVSRMAAELAELEAGMGDPDRADELDAMVTRYGEVQARFEELDGYSLEARARDILAGLGFAPAMVDGDVGRLSGGWKMRVALARILLMKPDALLLDEPTNHLDLESIVWLERFLAAFAGGLVITSHDREFLNRLVNRIVEIDGGELINHTGNYDFYERQSAIAAAQQEAQAARQQAMLAKEKAFIERFKARASHAAQVQSRVKKLEKIDVIEPPRRRSVPAFEFRSPPRSGEEVARVDRVSKCYGDRVIYHDFTFLVRRTERWAVMGVNGAGKSTLLRMIAGESSSDSGTVALGASVKMGYFAQHAMELLTGDESVIESLQRAFPMANIGTLRNLAGAFGFPGDDIQKRCGLLSGGEKARLVMAQLLFDPPNFLVLDEPTNHLDIATKEMLIRSLAQFEGTMLFVSHDREFLGAMSNRVLELTASGPRVFDGGYHEYVALTGYEAPGLH
jgi:ATPase subunit of ABC transporter with duplicated ATPase domains